MPDFKFLAGIFLFLGTKKEILKKFENNFKVKFYKNLLILGVKNIKIGQNWAPKRNTRKGAPKKVKNNLKNI